MLHVLYALFVCGANVAHTLFPSWSQEKHPEYTVANIGEYRVCVCFAP